MRTLLLVLFSAIAIFAEDPQATTAASQVPDNLSIPAKLNKSIDTKKCKAGDVVELRTLEPVLITNGLVMPEHTKLHGKIIGAASRKDDKPSWVLLMVDRAEWKDHSVPLRAFVTSQITMKAKVDTPNDSAFEGAISLPDSLYRRRSRSQTVSQSVPTSELGVTAAHPVRDGTVEAGDTQQLSYQRLDDVHILQAKNGAVFLLSQKDHLKLPSGTMFMLRNRLASTQRSAEAGKAAGDSH
jgi:hypothetical protein